MSDLLILSIIICTRNRVDWLRSALESVLCQKVHKDCYEVLVVDGDSTDGTREMVASLSDRHANVYYFNSPQPGLPRARVVGASAAQGRYIGYLDDDAIACSDWLDAALSIVPSVCDETLGFVGIEMLSRGVPAARLPSTASTEH